MYTEENKKWFFPVANFGTKQGLNDTGVETFLSSPLESLVRETIQNSLDARPKDSEKPVIVKFDFFNKPVSSVPGIESLLDEYLPAARRSWSEGSKESEFLRSMRLQLRQVESIKILRVSDYNTTGLDEINWDALVTETGVSSKADAQAAGSKGIGKNAPFAASELRMVVYNTKTVDYEKSIGVIIGLSYNEGDNGTSQARGYLGSAHNKPFDHQYSFHRDRTEIGTDVFVVGVKRRFENSQPIITLNVLEHFMLSVHNGLLEVHVDGSVISADTMSEFIEELSFSESDLNNRLAQVKNYYNVLKNEDTVRIGLDIDMVRKYPFLHSTDDAQLLLYAADELTSTNRVLKTRQSGMTIQKQPFRTGGVLFAGILQATAPELNVFLRKLESAEHDEWIPERGETEEDQRMARRFLRDLTNFMGSKIRELNGADDDEMIDAYGLAELLPNESEEDASSEIEHKGTIATVLSDITIRPPRKIKQQFRYAPDDPEIPGRSGPGVEDGEGRKTPGHTPKDPSGKRNPEPPRSSPVPSLQEVYDAKIRPVEQDYRAGVYILRVLPDRPLVDASIKLAASGEGGDYRVRILSSDNAEVVGDDMLKIALLPAGLITEIRVKINYQFRIKMKAVVYESK